VTSVLAIPVMTFDQVRDQTLASALALVTNWANRSSVIILFVQTRFLLDRPLVSMLFNFFFVDMDEVE